MYGASNSVAASIVAGGLAGASETFITVRLPFTIQARSSRKPSRTNRKLIVRKYPAEFVKTRRQLETSNFGKKSTNSITVLRSTLRDNGVKGIYAGCQTLAISNALKSGVRFFSFETAKRVLTPYFESNVHNSGSARRGLWLNVTAGLCAGAMESILIVTPGESLKTRIIHDAAAGGKLGKLSVPQLARYTVQQGGILSLWRGLTPVLCKQGTNSAVRFSTFSVLRDKLRNTWPNRMEGATATMLAGAGSGVITVYASMPFDNIKTRMQSIGDSGQRMTSVAANMLSNEGLSVFWRATTPRLVRLTLSSSITFMVYDYSLQLFDLLSPEPGNMKILGHT